MKQDAPANLRGRMNAFSGLQRTLDQNDYGHFARGPVGCRQEKGPQLAPQLFRTTRILT
jgi:hypothetical protein